MIQSDEPILSVRGLKTHFAVRQGLFSFRHQAVHAVDGVDFDVYRGRTLGLVGESGSGKTTVGRSILRLIHHNAGSVLFQGQDVFALGGRPLREMRRRIQIIFQDPVGSLNPRMTVGDIVGEPLIVHHIVPRWRRAAAVGELLERVGLYAGYVNRYPHEFSGGQRQRIGIARALASRPDFIVCDEPVSALDVSIQAQILNLLSDLQEQMGLSYLFIAHNLAVVEHFADQVAVMYLGKIVETASRDALYAHPAHPYTQALLSAVPRPEPGAAASRIRLTGEMPSPISPPTGCAFHPRCPLTRERAKDAPRSETQTLLIEGDPLQVMTRCTRETPALQPTAEDSSHCHACLLRQNAPPR